MLERAFFFFFFFAGALEEGEGRGCGERGASKSSGSVPSGERDLLRLGGTLSPVGVWARGLSEAPFQGRAVSKRESLDRNPVEEDEL